MSKKYFVAALSIAFLFCAFLKISAQENTFTEVDLTALTTAAEKKLEGKTYRLTTVYTNYINGSEIPVSSYKTVWETLPPDREHFISESQTAEGVKRFESIRIGDRRFVRENDGEWKELTGGFGTSGNGIGGGSSAVIEKTIERRLKKGEVVNNQKVDLYETITTFKYIYPTKTFSNIWTQKYWFDSQGRFVKKEGEYQNGEFNKLSRTVNEYKYDSKIKIEIPIKTQK